jgi:predicted O-methyltransferase YrrM
LAGNAQGAPPPPPAPPAPVAPPGIRVRLREEGPATVARSYLSDRYSDLVRRIAHRYSAPRISEFYRRAALQTTQADRLAAALPEFPADGWATWSAEFAEVAERLRARYRPDLPYPTVSAFSGAESALLYALVRGRAPDQVWETGVANGHSSFVILEALRRNGRGRLTSVDVRPDVGRLVPEELRSGWDLRFLSRRHPAKDLRALLGPVRGIGLFIHDSDHSYAWQTLEYRLAFERLAPDGLLASDDVDWSYAFLDFADRCGRKPLVLVSDSKAFGVLPPGPSPR